MQNPVGAAAGCDLLIFSIVSVTEVQDQKIAAFGSSYVDRSGITCVSIGIFFFVYKITTSIEQSLTRNANVAASLRSEVRAC
jgi:uncharacterized membrane protein YjfL (UPF0719 family)